MWAVWFFPLVALWLLLAAALGLGGLVWFFASRKERRPKISTVVAAPIGCLAIPIVALGLLAAVGALFKKTTRSSMKRSSAIDRQSLKIGCSSIVSGAAATARSSCGPNQRMLNARSSWRFWVRLIPTLRLTSSSRAAPNMDSHGGCRPIHLAMDTVNQLASEMLTGSVAG